jgi:FixJ family two-component response regulator
LPIVFLSGERVESYDRVAGLLLGADDCIVKPFAPDELVARVQRLSRRDGKQRSGTLTSRELEVLRLLAQGKRQPEIAADLVISPKTGGRRTSSTSSASSASAVARRQSPSSTGTISSTRTRPGSRSARSTRRAN